jgi:hypothetical protein
MRLLFSSSPPCRSVTRRVGSHRASSRLPRTDADRDTTRSRAFGPHPYLRARSTNNQGCVDLAVPVASVAEQRQPKRATHVPHSLPAQDRSEGRPPSARSLRPALALALATNPPRCPMRSFPAATPVTRSSGPHRRPPPTSPPSSPTSGLAATADERTQGGPLSASHSLGRKSRQAGRRW